PAAVVLCVVGAAGLADAVRRAAAAPGAARVGAAALVAALVAPWVAEWASDLRAVHNQAVVFADARAAAARLERSGILAACGVRLTTASTRTVPDATVR